MVTASSVRCSATSARSRNTVTAVSGAPVIASGGLASIEDIRRMMQPEARKLEGAIAGRALYDGRLDAKEALKLIRAARAA